MRFIYSLRSFLQVCSFLFGGFITISEAADKPNIVVLIGDDMGYADIGVHGCTDFPTPNIDALAATGVRCTNGYVSGPYCSPTRAGLLTGRYQTRFGHEFNPSSGPIKVNNVNDRARSERNNERLGLPLSEITMANRLRDAGYTTALIGKWHLGSAADYHPLRRGFDEFFGFLGGAHSYFPGEGPPIYRNEKPVEESDYLTDAFSRESVAFLDRQSIDQPFFLCVTFNAVHTPMHADDERLKKFTHIENRTRRIYAAMMLAMDDAIGEIVNKLNEKGFEKDTLVFFISDNGGPTISTTSVNGAVNSPLRGSKRTTLEGGVRVPFIVKWPGHLPAGVTYDLPVIQLDILPTSLVAAGINPPSDVTLEGVNLLPYLEGKNSNAPHDALYWRFGNQMAIRQGDWKLVKYDPAVDGETVPRGSATEAKLYHLATDVGETKNLMQQEPEKAIQMQAAWDAWNKSNVPPAWGSDGQSMKTKGGRKKRLSAGE